MLRIDASNRLSLNYGRRISGRWHEAPCDESRRVDLFFHSPNEIAHRPDLPLRLSILYRIYRSIENGPLFLLIITVNKYWRFEIEVDKFLSWGTAKAFNQQWISLKIIHDVRITLIELEVILDAYDVCFR